MATITTDKVANISQLVALCDDNIVSARYAIIRHDKDTASDHYHIAISYKSPRSIKSVSNALHMPSNFIEKWDNREDNLWSYLTHKTSKASAEKYHYDDYLKNPEKCVANFDLANTIDKISSKLKNKDIIKPICLQILRGDLTKKDLLKPDMIELYWEYKTKIDKAIQLRTESLLLDPPKCMTILISGKPASGKTTLAKTLAGYYCQASVSWASSANDPLQDYTGERCLIIDDFRPQDYEWQNLLALLDPNYRQRTHQSRYYNKPLATEVIILTSVLNIDDIISYYDRINDEPKKQLRRRIQTLYNTDTNETLSYYEDADAYQSIESPFSLKQQEQNDDI